MHSEKAGNSNLEPIMSSDHASKGAAVVATSAIFFILAVLAVLGRMIARFGFLKNGGGGDDIAIVVALVCLFTCLRNLTTIANVLFPIFLALLYCPYRCNMLR